MTYNLIGFLLLSSLALAAAGLVAPRLATWFPSRFLLLAVSLRLFGALTRYEILFGFYRGLGDAVAYYYEGLAMAASGAIDSASIFSAEYWSPLRGSWWGTAFITRVSGVVLKLIGPTMRGEFLVFSLLAFVGIFLIAAALKNVQPGRQSVLFALWIWCWPSLWFWPASVGKEALILLGIGLATYGYAGKNERMILSAVAGGLAVCFAVRPHVAAVVAISIVAAYWLGSWTRLTPRRIAESAVAVAIALVALQGMAAQFGLDLTDAEGVREFVEFRSKQTLSGGSQIGPVGSGYAGIPMAFVNIWMRPFPWDVHNATALMAAGEIVVFWWLVWRRRRGVVLALRNWRRHRLLRFAAPLLLAYTLMIGLTFSNLGIIARQRTPIVPFMFMLVLTAPETATAKRRERRVLPPARLPEPVST